MPRKRPRTRKWRFAPSRRARLFHELGLTGLSRAAEAHIQELSYERLKDPEYQAWMAERLEEFLSALAADFRAWRVKMEKKIAAKMSR